MFTGIIEEVGELTEIRKEGNNIHLRIRSELSSQLKIDQSISHQGVCLTVVAKDEHTHTVTAIDETLQRTNLGELGIGSHINLERAMAANGRYDGHVVQGHVDTTTTCIEKVDENGSWRFWFALDKKGFPLVVEKGSVCIDGVSLTVADALTDKFSVAVIPYTLEHTCFKYLEAGGKVNLEFDILGKYLARYMQQRGTTV